MGVCVFVCVWRGEGEGGSGGGGGIRTQEDCLCEKRANTVHKVRLAESHASVTVFLSWNAIQYPDTSNGLPLNKCLWLESGVAYPHISSFRAMPVYVLHTRTRTYPSPNHRHLRTANRWGSKWIPPVD